MVRFRATTWGGLVSTPPIERAFATPIAESASGILTVTEGRIKRLFCFVEGKLQFVASNIIEEQLEEFLVRENWINPGDRVKAKLESTRAKCSVWDWLNQSETLPAERLNEAIIAHSEQLIQLVLSAKTVEAEFAKGRPNLAGKPTTDWDPSPFLTEMVRTYPNSDGAVRVRIGRPDMHPSRNDKQSERFEAFISSDPVLQEMSNRCDGSSTINEILSGCSIGETRGLRALYALVLIGAVEDSEITVSAIEASDGLKAPVTRAELMARLERSAEATHYQVLEVMPEAEESQIVEAYYTLARRYHPDKFRHGAMVDLMPRIEEFFSQVTDAQHTLTNPEQRKQYDELLASKESQGASDEPQHDAGYLARQNFIRAKVLIQKGQYQPAVTFLENAIEQQENVPEYHMELGRVLTRNPRRREEAEQHLRHAVELDPTVGESHHALADFLVKRERNEEAQRAIEEGLKWVPGDRKLSALQEELTPRKGRGLFGR